MSTKDALCPMCGAGFPDNKFFPVYEIKFFELVAQVVTTALSKKIKKIKPLYKQWMLWDRPMEPPSMYKLGTPERREADFLWLQLQKAMEVEGES